MPAVVAESAEVSLVDCTVHELGSEGVVAEHVGKRIGLVFEPELRVLINVAVASKEDGGGFARVVDDCRCTGNGHRRHWIPLLTSFGDLSPERTHTITEWSSEEVIPRLEAIVLYGFVADIELIE